MKQERKKWALSDSKGGHVGRKEGSRLVDKREPTCSKQTGDPGVPRQGPAGSCGEDRETGMTGGMWGGREAMTGKRGKSDLVVPFHRVLCF